MKRDTKYSRINFDDRINIQAALTKKLSLSELTKIVHKSKSSIYREINNNKKIIIGNDEIICSSRTKNLVCNTCAKKSYCHLTKYYYDCQYAEEKAEIDKHISRAVPRLLKSQIDIINAILLEGVGKGQSIHHIYVSNPILASICSERTIRRLCDNNHLEVKSHQLRRYVTYKHEYKKPKSIYKLKDFTKIMGRTYNNYIEFTNKHKTSEIVQFDSVIGCITDKKAILTVTWKEFNFQIGLLVDKGVSHSTIHVLRRLFSKFTLEEIRKLFAVCLCDNGTEFTNFYDLEETTDGIKQLNTFYARPYRSTDKSECERNHEFIRYKYPKGKTMDNITQEELNELFSNINSYVRKSKGDKTPYELMVKKYGSTVVQKLGIRAINKRQVHFN